MARIRTVKPEFFVSETLAQVSVDAERTFMGLWTQADDCGRVKDRAAVLNGALWPMRPDHSVSDMTADLGSLAEVGLICRYTADDGSKWLHMPSWDEHQRINRPTPATSPPCTNPLHGGALHQAKAAVKGRAAASAQRGASPPGEGRTLFGEDDSPGNSAPQHHQRQVTVGGSVGAAALTLDTVPAAWVGDGARDESRALHAVPDLPASGSAGVAEPHPRGAHGTLSEDSVRTHSGPQQGPASRKSFGLDEDSLSPHRTLTEPSGSGPSAAVNMQVERHFRFAPERPAPDSLSTHGELSEDSRQEGKGKGKEGKGSPGANAICRVANQSDHDLSETASRPLTSPGPVGSEINPNPAGETFAACGPSQRRANPGNDQAAHRCAPTALPVTARSLDPQPEPPTDPQRQDQPLGKPSPSGLNPNMAQSAETLHAEPQPHDPHADEEDDMGAYDQPVDAFAAPACAQISITASGSLGASPERPVDAKAAKAAARRAAKEARQALFDAEYGERAEAICEHFVQVQKANLAAAVGPGVANRMRIDDKWRLAAQDLLRLDEWTVEQVVALIDWVGQDQFWRVNIRSLPTLRAKLDRLAMEERFQRWALANGRSTVAQASGGFGSVMPQQRASRRLVDLPVHENAYDNPF